MTPEKLSEWKKIAENGTEFEVVDMALTAVPELIAEVERLQRELEDRPDPDFVEFLNEQ